MPPRFCGVWATGQCPASKRQEEASGPTPASLGTSKALAGGVGSRQSGQARSCPRLSPEGAARAHQPHPGSRKRPLVATPGHHPRCHILGLWESSPRCVCTPRGQGLFPTGDARSMAEGVVGVLGGATPPHTTSGPPRCDGRPSRHSGLQWGSSPDDGAGDEAVGPGSLWCPHSRPAGPSSGPLPPGGQSTGPSSGARRDPHHSS